MITCVKRGADLQESFLEESFPASTAKQTAISRVYQCLRFLAIILFTPSSAMSDSSTSKEASTIPVPGKGREYYRSDE